MYMYMHEASGIHYIVARVYFIVYTVLPGVQIYLYSTDLCS